MRPNEPELPEDFWSRSGSRIDAGQGLVPHLRRPIPLPDGGELRTLLDAGNYVTKLVNSEASTLRWLAAIAALMLVAEHGGDTVLPRIGIMQALYSGGTVPTPRKKRARKYRIVR
jgi:hypothetical protein